jgi:putative nucleotidyltransferase with HDIG domain
LYNELESAYKTTLEGWAKALELRDKETEGHSRRVTEMTTAIARKLGLSTEEIKHVYYGALLHDIGKMGIPDEILNKAGELTPAEQKIVDQHPVFAHELLKDIGYLGKAIEIPYSHHEHWDGSGYPQGLKGEEIPLSARIFTVVDYWDALTSDRPYREAWSVEKAKQYLSDQSGKIFDPQIVRIFLEYIQD